MEEPQAEQTHDSTRGFWGLIGIQFQGAFSDNVLKFAAIMIVLARFKESPGLAILWGGAIGATFSLPFILFSGWSGVISDRYSKRIVMLTVKVAEIGIMAIGGVALYFYSAAERGSNWSFAGIVFALFLMGCHSTFFSPSKYGILPEILPPKRITWGNGILEMTTFISIIMGMIVGNGLYILLAGKHLEQISVFLIVLAVLGLISGLFIQKVPPARPSAPLVDLVGDLWANLKRISSDRVLLMTVLGLTYFWSLGAIMLQNAPAWGQFDLGMKDYMSAADSSGAHEVLHRFLLVFKSPGMLAAPVALGIGLGSVMVGYLSKRGIELGLVPLGGFGMAFFCVWLGLAGGGAGANPESVTASLPFIISMIICLILTGVAAGFFSVPLNALLQVRSPAEYRGGIIAAGNFANFIGIFTAMGLYGVIGFFHLSPANVFTICSLVTFVATLFLITLLPEALLGLVQTIVTRFIYRMRVIGAENIPREGPAVIVSNHISMVDALLITAISPRPVRFIVWKEIFDNPILGYFLKIMKAIPVSSDQRPRSVIASLSKAAEALNEGELVCIFSEGQVMRAGLPIPYRRGFKHVLDKAPVPIVPIYLDGVWGSIFSYEKGKFRWRWPRRFRADVQIAVGKPLPHDVSMFEMRQSVLGLSADCGLAKKDLAQPLHYRFIRLARKHPRQFCVADFTRAPINFGTTLIAGIIMARRLRKTWEGQEMVGIFLPPLVGAVVANVAAALSGRTVVNLNYTTGMDVLRHCINTCDLKSVVTSKAFLKKLGMEEPPPGAVYLEDLMAKKAGLGEKIPALLASKFLTIHALENYCGAERHPTADTLATIIFSSGSTGMPKGVMLTHFNIGSNIESFEKAVALWPDDRIIGFLPFFHSFGYTVTLWGCLHIGFGVIHHPNPLEAKVIGDLIEKYGVTVMIGTPTFLQNYIRRVEPEKFKSLEFVLTGAEALPERVIDGFKERFGQTVYEGYGTTECAPVVSANVDDYRSLGNNAAKNKRGSVGHPIPGVVVRIVDVDTRKVLGAGERGMIEVRGANIMQGYYKMPEKTAEVLREGWYETGDLGFIDDGGFLHITGRLARFSKIGGEMVPHVMIEDELHRVFGLSELTFAVTAVPHETRGEQLVVVHTMDEEQLKGIGKKLADAGLPNLWIPDQRMFFKVEHIPVLGSGKLDLAQVKKLAKELVSGEKKPEPAHNGSENIVIERPAPTAVEE